MSKKKAATRNALRILGRRDGKDPDERVAFEQELLSARIAQAIYNMRKAAGMTQQQLADAIKTTQSAISRLEDADTDGPSLGTLQRIAIALNARAVLEINPEGQNLVKI